MCKDSTHLHVTLLGCNAGLLFQLIFAELVSQLLNSIAGM